MPDVGQVRTLAQRRWKPVRAGWTSIPGWPCATRRTMSRLVVVVDQFEEVFTYRPQDEQAKARFEHRRAAFLANLLHAAARPGGRWRSS